MRKNIILKSGIVQAMTIDEVIIQFKPLISRFTNRCVNMSKTQEKEDYEQIAMIKIFECFNDYDEQHVFTTRLMTKLKGEVSKIASYDESFKRNAYKKTSMDAQTEEEESIADKIGDVDFGIEYYAEDECINEIMNQLNIPERHMYIHIIDGGMSVNQYAQMIGTSRQAENYRYRKLVKKLREMYICATSID